MGRHLNLQKIQTRQVCKNSHPSQTLQHSIMGPDRTQLPPFAHFRFFALLFPSALPPSRASGV